MGATPDRQAELTRFYKLLDELGSKLGGRGRLAQCDGRMIWPERGVYFFFEQGENRSESGSGSRVVRIGTHALKLGSQTTLWKRLSQHRGTQRPCGGNHRGSVFRKHVGKALLRRDPDLNFPSWGQGNNAPSDARGQERPLEALVSGIIGEMPFLWLDIDDAAGPESLRGYVERNAIALLSNFGKELLNPPSTDWLGSHCPSERVQKSGLWNSNHVNDIYDDTFLEKFADLIARQRAK